MASFEDTFIGMPPWAKALALIGVLALLSAGYYVLIHGSIATDLEAAQEQKQQLQDQIRDAERREKQYDSEVKKKADADRYAVEQAAEAEKLRQMRRAEARQFEIEAEAKARAEGARAEGLADAEVIRERGLAEAEAKEKLAEAFEKFGEAAVLDLLAKMMPELAREVAAPLASIQRHCCSTATRSHPPPGRPWEISW